VLDDEVNITTKLCKYLNAKGHRAFPANDCDQALQIVHNQKVDIAIIDVVLPEDNGLKFVNTLKDKIPDLELIIMSGYGNMDMVIEAIHKKAVDFVRKPFGFLDIISAIERTQKFTLLQNQIALKQAKYSLIPKELEEKIRQPLIGKSDKIQEVLQYATRIANDPDVNVLITGENGTGKEVIASLIHYASERKEQEFHIVNCSAIPETLLESEFFGHRKGAFTDAKENKKGYFELSNQGTLLLDEIADMPISLQAKLLRAIEQRKFKPIGGEKEIYSNVRIISATNQNIEKLIAAKKFRLDLLHRINTFIIEIPSLRERPEDIEPLLMYFIHYFATKKNKPIPRINKKIINILCKYEFPGNVRELRNMAERAVVLANNRSLCIDDFMQNLKNNKNRKTNHELNLVKHEIDLITEALISTQFNQIRAAEMLGISRDALIRRMRKYNITINKKLWSK
jgi:DNA-binding NtrC family response regulator